MSDQNTPSAAAPQDAGEATVTLSGELDAHDVTDLRERFDQLPPDARRVVVDLTDVTFIDSSVLGVLVHARNRAVSAGGEVYLVGVQANVLRVLSITDLVSVFPIYDTMEEVPRGAG